jgi:hypothetical protein
MAYVLQYYEATNTGRQSKPGVLASSSPPTSPRNEGNSGSGFMRRKSIAGWKSLSWTGRHSESRQKESPKGVTPKLVEFIAGLDLPCNDNIAFIPDVYQCYLTLLDVVQDLFEQMIQQLKTSLVSYGEVVIMSNCLTTVEHLLRQMFIANDAVRSLDAVANNSSRRAPELIAQDLVAVCEPRFQR